MTRTPQPTPELLLDTPDLKISALWGGSDRLFVAFNGVGAALGGIQTEEFVGTTSGGSDSALFVTDCRRSWYNGPADPGAPEIMRETARIVDAAKAARGFRRLATIGNSMGGFGAILFSAFAPVGAVISFAPQFSVDPRVVPAETRWRAYTSAIAGFRHPDLSHSFVDGSNYYIFHGDGAAEQRQWRLFPPGERICHVIVPGADHDVARLLKRKRLLKPVVELCLAGHTDALRALLREHCRAHAPGEGLPRRRWWL